MLFTKSLDFCLITFRRVNKDSHWYVRMKLAVWVVKSKIDQHICSVLLLPRYICIYGRICLFTVTAREIFMQRIDNNWFRGKFIRICSTVNYIGGLPFACYFIYLSICFYLFHNLIMLKENQDNALQPVIRQIRKIDTFEKFNRLTTKTNSISEFFRKPLLSNL